MNVFSVSVQEHHSKYSVALCLVSTNTARVFVELCCCPPSCREVSVDVELQSGAPGTCRGSVQFKDT